MSVFVRIFVAICFSAACFGADLIVRAEPSYLRQLAARFGLLIRKQIAGHNIFLVRGPAGTDPQTLIAQLHNYDQGGEPDTDDDNDDDVYAEPSIAVYLAETAPGLPRLITNTAPVVRALADRRMVDFHGTPAWTGFVNQPAIRQVRIPETHRQFGSAGPVVAVIDTGIDPEHPLLRGALVSGYDFVRDVAGAPSELEELDAETRSLLNPYTTAILDSFGEANPYTTAILDSATASRLDPRRLPPQFGHGTMVAGLVRRVAPGARIMPLKPFGRDGRAHLFPILQSVYFAVDHGARVINMSLSMASSSPLLEEAIRYASAKGAVVVASVGNSGLEIMAYPAGYQEVIGVASTDLNDAPSIFTNFGDNVTTLAAPGEGLITLYPGGRYAAGWGTSFSTPLVAGTVALMMHLNPGLNWEKAEAALQEAAPANGNLGNGRLDTFRAVTKSVQF